MKYALNTKIRFAVALDRCMQEEVLTLDDLGFTQEDLQDENEEEIEKELQEMYLEWEVNHLDGGWAMADEDS